MTREEAKNAIEVMQAYVDGKEIEYLDAKNEWTICQSPEFDLKNYYYRIKQEPTYRPFKDKEECWNEIQKHQPFMWAASAIAFVCIDEVNYEGVRFGNALWYYERAFKELKFADGTPFGIKEE